MKRTASGIALVSLLVAQVGAMPALAQATRENPAAAQMPERRPAPVTKPAKPAKPGFGGSGGSGGNRPDFGGSGGSGGSGGNRPGFGGSGGSGGNNGGGWGGGWGGSGGWNNGPGGTIRCESWSYRYARCNADTSGGVRLARVIAGDCRQGRNWGYSRGYVWVNNGCRADFDTRGGNNGGNNGPSAGAVIAGVAVAAGLIALLASKGKKSESATTSQQMASINIGPGAVPGAAEPAFRTCVEEVARQIGATGGRSIRLLGGVSADQNRDEWQFRLPLEASWADDTQPIPATCRATAGKLIDLTFQPS